MLRHLITTMINRGQEPDVIVNITNDGWFHGSSELDMHLICAVFRAVECRKPVVIAANTGFSAWIDANGQIVRRAKRHDADVVLAEVCHEGRLSLYLRYGDILAGVCLLFCLITAIEGVASGLWRWFPRVS